MAVISGEGCTNKALVDLRDYVDQEMVKNKTRKKFKEGDVVKTDSYSRLWVVFEVTQKEFDETDINVECPGLYAFGGMWYGTDITSRESFGKVLPLDDSFEVVGNFQN